MSARSLLEAAVSSALHSISRGAHSVTIDSALGRRSCGRAGRSEIGVRRRVRWRRRSGGRRSGAARDRSVDCAIGAQLVSPRQVALECSSRVFERTEGGIVLRSFWHIVWHRCGR